MAAHVASVNIVQRHHQAVAGGGHGLGSRHDGLGLAEHGTHGPATGLVPDRCVLELAVKRMMPGGPLKRQQMTHLKIYAGASHPHDAQNPKPLDIKAMNPKNAVRG